MAMISEESAKRLGIVASIVTLLGALIWLLSRNGTHPLLAGTVVSPSGSIDPVGTPTLFQTPDGPAMGEPGPQGPGGTPGTPGAPGSPGPMGQAGSPEIGGTPGYDGAAGYPGARLLPDWVYDPQAASDYVPGVLSTNLAAFWDWPKQAMLAAFGSTSGSGSGGCGCGGHSSGGCGCNPAAPALFVDGTGNCVSSTVATLTGSMESCQPGTNARALQNLQTMQFYGIDAHTGPADQDQDFTGLTTFAGAY